MCLCVYVCLCMNVCLCMHVPKDINLAVVTDNVLTMKIKSLKFISVGIFFHKVKLAILKNKIAKKLNLWHSRNTCPSKNFTSTIYTSDVTILFGTIIAYCFLTYCNIMDISILNFGEVVNHHFMVIMFCM